METLYEARKESVSRRRKSVKISIELENRAREAEIAPLVKKSSRRNLFYSALSANLLYISLGCALAWSSPAIPILRKNGMEPGEETWMVSILILGGCFGPSVFNITIDRFGRKMSLILTGVIYLISWIILGVSTNIYSLCIGRFIGGLAMGASLNCVPVYVSEIADAEMRQSLSSMTEFFVSVGAFIEYGAGPLLSYTNIVLVSVIPTIVFLLAILFVPESPYHLLANDNEQDAREILQWLRGPNHDLTEEIQQIEVSVKELSSSTGSAMDLIHSKGPRTALLLSLLMFFVLPFTAIDILTEYMGPILAKTSLPITSDNAAAIIGAMNIVFAAWEPFIVHKFGSKWTYITCSFACSLFLICFGVYRLFDEMHYDMTSLTAVPIACILLFELFFMLGVGAISWSISVELFPPNLKGFAINIVTTEHWIVDFIVVNLFGYLEPVFGASYCFIFCSLVLIAGTIVTAIFLPDTKGLALSQIHNDLHNT